MVQSTEMRQCLMGKQAAIYDHIYDTVIRTNNNDNNHANIEPNSMFFIDGKAGKGKTFLLNCLIMHLQAEGQSIAVCSTTGLSATLYPHERTVYSLFNISVTPDNTEL